MEDSKGSRPGTASDGGSARASQTAPPPAGARDLVTDVASDVASDGAASVTSDLVIVLCTFPKPEDLGEIAFTLVAENLCACVNILHESLSIYRWKGEIVTNKEVLCLIKTTRARHAELVARLAELHPYDVPEIVTLPTHAVNEPYLRWVKEETAPRGPGAAAGQASRERGDSETPEDDE